MMNNSLLLFALLMLQGFLVIVIAPLLIGWINMLKCWLQNRSAPSIFQPYFVFYKLLLKEPVLAQNSSWLFRSAPFIYAACFVIIAFIVPFFLYCGLLSSIFDVIVLVGIFALARIFIVLAAMDIGSAFNSLGARRELFLSCLVEPILLLVLLNLGLITHGLTLGHMSLVLIQKGVLYPGIAFSLCAYIFVILAENGRFPFDNSNTHLEVTMIHEAMMLEHSGRYLALIEWGNALKLILFLLIFINLFIPFGLSYHFSLISLLVGLSTTFIKLIILSALLAFTEALQTKIRVFRIPEYLSFALFLALLGIFLTQLMGVPNS